MTSEVDLVARVAETLDLGGWSVTVEKPLDGIQVDAYVTRPGEAPVVVECKAYRNLVGLRTAREFASVVDYLREETPAIRGWLVTTTGFTQNAADALRRHGIEGYTLSELQQRIRPIQPNVLKQSPIWTEEIANAKRKKKHVFVIMPFSDAMLDVFILGIRWAASELDAVAERADDLAHNGEMMDEIRTALTEYDVVVGDTSGANPNVCYEIGYAHALNRPTILICRQGQELPFDLQGTNHLMYPNVLGLREPLKRKLGAALGVSDDSEPER